MDPNTQRLLASSGGAAERIYVEDVFSTWLYTGNNSTQTITNGIDLSGKGGLVWIKDRSNAGQFHYFFDTARGATKSIYSNSTYFQETFTDTLTSFNSTGFSLGANLGTNWSSYSFASWTFRKAAKFFDVVTWTGSGANRTIAHNLDSVPGTIIVKRTNTTGDWQVYHRSLANTEYMVLNSTAAKATGTTRWNSTTPTSSEFSLGTDATVNASGGTYVAYLFAHDAGGFGDAGDQSVVKCGSFTTPSSGSVSVDLGWEPQWVLFKSSSNQQSWRIIDNMRGFYAASQNSRELLPDTSGIEADTQLELTATGFSASASAWGASRTFIYIAIRRGPMKTPTDATKVFQAITNTGNGDFTNGQTLTPAFPVDLAFAQYRSAAFGGAVVDRIRGITSSLVSAVNPYLAFYSTSAENGSGDIGFGDSNTTYKVGQASGYTTINYAFRRAPGFFDVVAYTGTGSARTVSHNLGVAPELIILKSRSAASTRWPVYQKFYPTTGGNLPEYGTMFLNTTDGWVSGGFAWNNTAPTATAFSVNFTNEANGSGATYIAYLFATCPGVSKVGSYTGTGTTLSIDCGFTNGARFVLIKRTDSTGSWYVWDTARGIIAANDPYLLLNSTAAEVTNTDYIDPLSSGFQISSTAPAAINANGGSFIYLAIA
jgi:hypothetical protein